MLPLVRSLRWVVVLTLERRPQLLKVGHSLFIILYLLPSAQGSWVDLLASLGLFSGDRIEFFRVKAYNIVSHRPDKAIIEPATQKYVALGVWPDVDAILPTARGNVSVIYTTGYSTM